ncbi:hypothetical protein F511_31597 [Dorcoceras hygrometricum]|uniref:Dystroglycan-like n=1 Tax=Dorcoceras hygrometricum TaxID=472368 RepID=A0A2Z7D6L7_9LAMI|nr:hypothetical protein F511_31597 [Dorcoceras hygrometricum]
MENSFAYVSTTVGRLSFKKTALLTSSSRNMFRGNSDACVSITDEILPIKKTALLTSSSRNMFRGNSDACVSVTDEGLRTKKIALLTSLHLIVCKGNRSAYVSIADRGLHSLHSQMTSSFITNSYQINFESVLMIHDNEGMLNMFKALEASGLRQFLGCESTLYEAELGHFFETALLQDEDITCTISGKFITISPSLFTTVFDLPTEGISNFSEVPKDKVYDARSLFSQKGLQIEVHGKKKFMKHEFRLLNDILAKAITVKAGSFDSVTVEQFQMMTAIQYGLKVNWGKVLFDVLKDMVDRTQNKAKGFAVQIGVLLKSFPAIPMGDGVPFPSAKVLSMRTVHTYIVTNTTIDARTESEEPRMAKTPKGKKKHSFADEMPADMWLLMLSQFKLLILLMLKKLYPPLVLQRKSRKRKLVLSRESDDDSVGNGAQTGGSTNSVAAKETNMPIDDLLVQLCDDLLLPVTAAEVTMLRLGAFSSSGEMAVVDFFASFSLNSMPDMDSLKELKEKERLMMAWAETNTLAIAVRRQLYVLEKYRELLLRTVLESYQRYLTSALPWNAIAVQVANLLSVAHSNSIEELKAQQQELNIELVQSHSSLPAMDYIDSGDVRLAHFYSITKSSCWVRPVFLMNEVWTPVQGPEFWSSSCNLSLFLDHLQMPAPAIQEIFLPHISFVELDQYWATVPWLMRIWNWTKVCEEIVAFNLSDGLRPVRKDASYAITVHNLGVERIPADFLRLFAQGLACNNFVDSVVKKDLGDTEEVVLSGIEEVDSLEHDLRFALGPAILSRTEQEERLYFVQSPDSPPAVSPHHEYSSCSTDVSLHFDSTDVPVHAQAAPHAPASVDSTKLAEILDDLQSSLAQRIHDSNCEMLSKLSGVELGVRGDLLKMQSLLRQSFETACRVLERQSNTHTTQITDLKKGLLGPVGIIFGSKNHRQHTVATGCVHKLLERSPTLPRTSKTTTGNEGKSPEKLTAEQCSRVRRIRNERLEIFAKYGIDTMIRRPSLPINSTSNDWKSIPIIVYRQNQSTHSPQQTNLLLPAANIEKPSKTNQNGIAIT